MDENTTSHGFSMHPLAFLAGSFAAGIIFAQFTATSRITEISLALILAILAYLCRRSFFATVLIAVAFFFLGSASLHLQKSSISDNRIKSIYDNGIIASDDPTETEGKVVGGLRPAYGGYFLQLDAEMITHRENQIPVSGIVRFYAAADDEALSKEYAMLDIRHNDTIKIAARLQREDKYLNPGVMLRRQILDQQGLDATGNIKSPLLIEIVDKHKGLNILGELNRFRDHLILEFREIFSTQTAGILIAVTLGDEHFLDHQTADIFRSTGTFHILVISGLHITFLGGLLLLIFRSITANRLIKLFGVCILLWIYILMTGTQPPSVRAGIMFTLILIGIMFYRQMSLLNSLGACALILLIFDPILLFNPSFQLTFVSVIAIAVTAFPLIEKLRQIGNWTPDSQTPFPPNVNPTLKRFCETLYWKNEVWSIQKKRNIWSAKLFKSPLFNIPELPGVRNTVIFIFEAAIVSSSVMLWMLPLMVVYFHRIAFSEILLNVWVGTFMAANSLMAIAVIILKQISASIALPFIYLIEFNTVLMLLPADGLTTRNLANLRVPLYSGKFSLIYYLHYAAPVILAVLLARWNHFSIKNVSRSFKTIFAASFATAIITCLIISFHPFSSPAANGSLRVDFLDVGQGDAAFITFPNGQTMLIDGGGKPDFRKKDADESDVFEPDLARIGEMVVSEFLWEKGYSRIDHIIGTHSDADHIQGLVDVIKNFDIGDVYLSQLPDNNDESRKLQVIMDLKGIDPIAAERGLKLEIDGAIVEFMYPQTADINADLGNNGSVVLKITYGSKSFLFTGDIEMSAETTLLASGTDLKADVIKVPHHGSRTSSTADLIRSVKPLYAVIPVGRRSIFNHPHPDVVERWRNAGAEVMTTGERGAITMVTDGNNISVEKFAE